MINLDYFIPKREFEQLCVLFFRSAMRDGIFGKEYVKEEERYEDDYFSIYYTLYGPCVATSSGRKYEVKDENRLSGKMLQYDYINKGMEEGYIVDLSMEGEIDNNRKDFAQIFAYDLLFLKYVFESQREGVNLEYENVSENMEEKKCSQKLETLKKCLH